VTARATAEQAAEFGEVVRTFIARALECGCALPLAFTVRGANGACVRQTITLDGCVTIENTVGPDGIRTPFELLATGSNDMQCGVTISPLDASDEAGRSN
jgi:hypothetical protein